MPPEFLLTVLLLELTPGPNMGYLAALAATQGRTAGLAATAGVAAGLSLHAIAAAVGVSALVARSPAAYEVLRWAGVGFLAWLAWETWRGAAEAAAAERPRTGRAGLFWRGLATNVLSPKSALFFVAVVPRFLDSGAPRAGQLLLLGGTYVAVATAVHATVVLLAARLSGWLRVGARERRVRRGLALALLGIALWLAWDTRR